MEIDNWCRLGNGDCSILYLKNDVKKCIKTIEEASIITPQGCAYANGNLLRNADINSNGTVTPRCLKYCQYQKCEMKPEEFIRWNGNCTYYV